MGLRSGYAVPAAALVLGLGLLVAPAAAQQQGPDGRRPRGDMGRQLSPEDRGAFLDARMAALRAGLRLTADQEVLWPAVEAAARERANIQTELRRKDVEAGPPGNLIEGLRRRGEVDAARGGADLRLADAAQPLWASLSDEQKRRFPMLARGIINAGGAEQGPRGDNRPAPERSMGQERRGPRADAPGQPGPLAPPPR